MNADRPDQPTTSRHHAIVRSFLARHRLKSLLILTDSVAILIGCFMTLWATPFIDVHGLEVTLLVSGFATAAGLWATRSQGLLLARVSAIRAVEITRIARAMVVLAGLLLLFDRVMKVDLYIRYTLWACAACFVAVCTSRSLFRLWVDTARANGRYRRRVVIVGVDEEAVRVIDLLRTHRDIGMDIVGVIGDPQVADEHRLVEQWLGDIGEAEAIMGELDVSGVVIVPNGVPPLQLNLLVRQMHVAGRHVHLGTGIAGIDARRLRALPLAYEPFFHVEAPVLARVQLVVKHAFDLFFSGLAMVILSPVFLAVAVAIKLDDGGPVLFKQTRVGRSGKTFAVYKFRSMSTDADKQLAALRRDNERNGPLFKMERDPRVTRIGKILRDSSLDELPQLINVLRGEMSLVGPRPALPSEVLAFPAGLRVREQVRPGITGLWQVEARDSPSFEAYRRLDIFYVENWSMTLDLVIIVGTLEQTLGRVLKMLTRKPQIADASVGDPAVVEV